ncbi:MAG: iron transporter [Bifidobacteriaceae bacterium]|nr:iron transporter [Bifidobacteriaceae bacterium]
MAGAAALALTLGLAGCGDGSSSSSKSTDTDAVTEEEDEPGATGFEEFPLGDEQIAGPLVVAGVYFQPVDMEPAGMGLAAADSNFHLEADVSAGPNDLGYGLGSFVPNLTVDYKIETEGGALVQEGTFMQMNASDGPHYGANIALKDAGAYKVTFIIHSPEENGHLLHVDPETGVTGRFWTEPLEVSWDWDYTPTEW